MLQTLRQPFGRRNARAPTRESDETPAFVVSEDLRPLGSVLRVCCCLVPPLPPFPLPSVSRLSGPRLAMPGVSLCTVRLRAQPRLHASSRSRCAQRRCVAVAAASNTVDELLAAIKGSDSGASASVETRQRVLDLATTMEAAFAEKSADPRTSPLLVGDYRVSYTSSPQAAGGRFRSDLGRALFSTHALYQNVKDGVVSNRVEFRLFRTVPGSISLRGPLKAVEPLRVTPRDAVVAGEGRLATLGAGSRTFGGAVEVSFEAPVLEIAGASVTLGGASTVRLATTYLDERIRVGRGGFGSLFIFERMAQGAQAAAALPCSPRLKAAGWVLARLALLLFTALSALTDAARLATRAARTPSIAIASALALAAQFYSTGALTAHTPHVLPAAAGAVHALALSIWLGATIWVTFGQGDVLYKLLPRHTFATLCAALRPRFLAVSLALAALSLASLAAMPAAVGDCSLRLLRLALAATAANTLWAEPSGTRLGAFRDKFEADAGIGGEVGTPPAPEKLTPTLLRLNARIARFRAASAALTLVAVAAAGTHTAMLGARLAMLGA